MVPMSIDYTSSKLKQFNVIKLLFSIYVVILPIISLYVFSGSITVGQVGLVFLVLICSFDIIINGRYLLKKSHLFIYLFSILLNTIIIVYENSGNEILFRNILQFLYIFFVLLFVKYYADSKIVFKTLRYVTIFACLYLILQWVLLHAFSFYLPGTIPFLEVSRNDLSVEYYNQLIGWGVNDHYRARSIFGEGAEFCQYVLCYFILILNQKNIRANFEKILITVAVVLSSSALGIICVLFLWLYLFLKNINIQNLIILLILFGLVLVISRFTIAFDIVLERLFDEDNSSFYGRFNGYLTYFDSNLDVVGFLFGNGIIALDNSTFMPSNLGQFVCFGVVGCIGFIYFLVRNFIEANSQRRIMIVYLTIVGFAANLLFYHFTIFILVFYLIDFDSDYISAYFLRRTKDERYNFSRR